MSLCLRGRLNPVLWSFNSIWWGSNPRSSDHSCVRSSDHSCVKLMASYHEIASRLCDTYVGEFSCSRSCDRPPPYFVWFLDFVCRILEFSSSPIFVISIDMIYQFLCIGEFVCHWLDFLRWFLEFMLHQFSWFPLISFINICVLVNLCVMDFCDWHWYNRQYLWFDERNKEYGISLILV